MSRNALSVSGSFHKLNQAWETLFSRSSNRSRHTRGFDDESMLDFARNKDSNLRTIGRELATSRPYGFSPLIAHLIPKTNGGNRVICIPTVRDRIVQRSLSDFFAVGDKCRLDNQVSFGFIPGKSVKKAARKSCDLRATKRWAYKTDISKFFDNIERDRLAQAISKFVREKSLHPILVAAANCEIAEDSQERRKKIAQAGICSGKGVRQGMPLSPFFANLILRDFDTAIQCSNISMVRYADDLIAFAETELECQNIHRVFVQELGRIELCVPDFGPNSKTKIFSPAETAEFLGLGIRPDGGSYVIEVLPDQLKNIRQRIIDSASFESLIKRNVTLGSYLRYIDGVLAGFAGAYDYCDNFPQLEKMLSQCRNESITLVLRDGLGIPVHGLSKEAKIFLGLDPL